MYMYIQVCACVFEPTMRRLRVRKIGTEPGTWNGRCLRHGRLEKRLEHYLTPTVSGFQNREDRPTNVLAVSRGVNYLNTHRPVPGSRLGPDLPNPHRLGFLRVEVFVLLLLLFRYGEWSDVFVLLVFLTGVE